MKLNEIWKPVVGFEELYEVSNLGRVKALKRKKNCNRGWGWIKEHIMSDEQKIINLENEISFLKNALCEKQKEIEEKTTIIMAGAEKVKQLEKGNRSLMESRIKWKNRYYKEKEKNKECISKDKIRERIEEARKIRWHIPKLVIEYFEELLEEK